MRNSLFKKLRMWGTKSFYLCESSGQTLSPGKFSTLADSSDLEYSSAYKQELVKYAKKIMRWIRSGGTYGKNLRNNMNKILPFPLPPLIGHHPVCSFKFRCYVKEYKWKLNTRVWSPIPVIKEAFSVNLSVHTPAKCFAQVTLSIKRRYYCLQTCCCGLYWPRCCNRPWCRRPTKRNGKHPSNHPTWTMLV